jgi:hypothetical protein
VNDYGVCPTCDSESDITRLNATISSLRTENERLKAVSDGWETVVARLSVENERLRKIEAAAKEVSWQPVRSLIDGCSLPMDMQPSRERWLREMDRLCAALLSSSEVTE